MNIKDDKEVDVKQVLQQLAEYQAINTFDPKYFNPDNQFEREVHGLGKAISSWAELNAYVVVEMFLAALTDLNLINDQEAIMGILEPKLRSYPRHSKLSPPAQLRYLHYWLDENNKKESP